MSDNAQKTAFGRSANELARKKALDAIQITGKSLPCSIVSISGWIATVKFEVDAAPFTLQNVIVPVASSQYDYLPLQAGDPGVVRAADARLGGLSGLGGGVAKLVTTPGNLSTLVFEPFGKVAYTAPADPLMRVVQGPNGVIVQTLDGSAFVKITKDLMTLTCGSATITLNKDGTITIGGIVWGTHEHTGVQTGSAKTGGPTGP